MKNQKSKSMPKQTRRVLGLLPVGAERPITGKELASLTGMNRRVIQAIINRLILDYGIPICGNRDQFGGYYIPANDTERLAGISSLRNQQVSEAKRLDALIVANLDAYKQYLEEGD